jgi:hypothetical protein
MMVLRMTKYAGSNFLGKTLCRSFGELVVSVMLVSWWSLNCVSVVVGVLCGILVVCPWLSWGVFGDVFCSYLGGVSVVSRRCYGGVFGGIEGMAFSWLSWITSQDNIGAKGNAKLCYWGSMLA